MNSTYIKHSLLLLILAIFGLAACSSAESTPQQIANETVTPEAELAEASPTAVLPTASSPTITPTKGPATATPTRVIPPSVTPTPLPATPTPALQIYVVEQYDTLLGIAVEFDTTVEALLAANGINENDFLQVGQELIIPAVEQESGDNDAVGNTQSETSGDTSTQANAGNTNSVNVDTPANATGSETVAAGTTTESAAAGASGITTTSAPSAPVVSPPNISRPANINPLTGLAVEDPAVLRRRPLLVRIGNDVGARASQAGLNSADVVYEEITEWWVTRFTAIFLSETPQTVAPIRSARLINVQLVPQYQGALAHSGGSDAVRWEISQAPIVNLDEFYNPFPYYYRPNEGWQTRLALDIEAAREYMESKGTEAPVSLHGFLFSDSVDTGQEVENIFIPYPRATTFTQWRYVPTSGKYLRFAADQPLSDANGLGQVTADNVIVYFAEHQETDIVEDSNGATSIRILVNGTGPAWFFRDGKLNKGYWQTDGTRTPYFMYEDGSPYNLKPGNTWIEVVPSYFTIGLDDPGQASARP